MNQINEIEEYEPKKFEYGDDITKEKVCKKSGRLANKYCDSTITEYFAKGSQPTKKCDYHDSKTKDKEKKEEETTKKKQND